MSPAELRETFTMRKQTNKQTVREKKLFSIFCLEATGVYHTSFGRTNSWLRAKQNFPWRVNGATDPDTEVWEYMG